MEYSRIFRKDIIKQNLDFRVFLVFIKNFPKKCVQTKIWKYFVCEILHQINQNFVYAKTLKDL